VNETRHSSFQFWHDGLTLVLVGGIVGSLSLGCNRQPEQTEKKSPPIARVELPPAAQPPVEAPPRTPPPPPIQEPTPGDQAVVPPVPPPRPTKTGIVTARLLNVRSNPDVKAEKIGVLPQNEPVLILAEQQDWYRINAYAGYLEGWVVKSQIAVSPSEGATARRP
jgi:uncharacterized protein YgiM (DUF1202 family)